MAREVEVRKWEGRGGSEGVEERGLDVPRSPERGWEVWCVHYLVRAKTSTTRQA